MANPSNIVMLSSDGKQGLVSWLSFSYEQLQFLEPIAKLRLTMPPGILPVKLHTPMLA